MASPEKGSRPETKRKTRIDPRTRTKRRRGREGLPKLRQHGGGGWRVVYFLCVALTGWRCMASGVQVAAGLQPVLESPTGDHECIGTKWNFGCAQRQQTGAVSAAEAIEPEEKSWTEGGALAKCIEEETIADAGVPGPYQSHSQERAREVCCRKGDPRPVNCGKRTNGSTRKRRDGSRGDRGELAGLLGMAPKIDSARSEAEFQKLQSEKQYLSSVAMQLQEQINFIMANGGVSTLPGNPLEAFKPSPKRSSPQTTVTPVGPFKRAKTNAEDSKDGKMPECEDLTGLDS